MNLCKTSVTILDLKKKGASCKCMGTTRGFYLFISFILAVDIQWDILPENKNKQIKK